MKTEHDQYEDNKEFVKAFNEGYIIAKHEKDVSDIIVESLGIKSPFSEGFFAGMEEGEKERLELERLDELGILRDPAPEHDLDR
ncbi:MAG: hypothetical protein AB7P01_14670 [Bacteroidia bacterium]